MSPREELHPDGPSPGYLMSHRVISETARQPGLRSVPKSTRSPGHVGSLALSSLLRERERERETERVLCSWIYEKSVK